MAERGTRANGTGSKMGRRQDRPTAALLDYEASDYTLQCYCGTEAHRTKAVGAQPPILSAAHTGSAQPPIVAPHPRLQPAHPASRQACVWQDPLLSGCTALCAVVCVVLVLVVCVVLVLVRSYEIIC